MTKYLATSHYANTDISCKTDEMNVLMNFLSEHENAHQDVIDALTGELLYISNNPSGEDFIEEQFLYATIGWSYLNDADPEPDPREEILRYIIEVCEDLDATLILPQ